MRLKSKLFFPMKGGNYEYSSSVNLKLTKFSLCIKPQENDEGVYVTPRQNMALHQHQEQGRSGPHQEPLPHCQGHCPHPHIWNWFTRSSLYREQDLTPGGQRSGILVDIPQDSPTQRIILLKWSTAHR